MTGARASDSTAIALLRSAARDLLPIVLEMGQERVRFSSFVGAVVEEDGGSVVLEPIAEALPEVVDQPFRIAPAGGGGWFIVATRIARESAHRVRINLAQARAFASDAATALIDVSGADLLVLVVPGGLQGSSAYVFPVQRIGPDACEIRSSVAIEPGRELDCVEIVGDRQLLRRASAQVLESIPWYLPDGSRGFCCKLSLNEHGSADERPDPHDLVTDPTEVRRLLELAGMMSVEGWYEAPGWGRGLLRFISIDKAAARFSISTLPRRDATWVSRAVRVGVDLFAVSYELDVRILRAEAEELVTSLPLILRRRRRHRRDHRVPVLPPDHVELSFRNPVSGAVQTHEVAEVSLFAICFECEPTNNVLWRGLPLEQAQLSWRNHLVHLGDLVVEQCGYDETSRRIRCTAAVALSRIADDPDMIGLLATLMHPQVSRYEGEDFSALHRIYVQAGLFGPHMDRNLAPLVAQTQEVWRKLHVGASDMVRTFVHGPSEAPDAAVTILRAWEHAWVAQHFVDTSPDINGATGKLQQAYLDHLVPRPDGRYLVFFVKTDNRVMNAYLRRFFGTTGTPDAVTRSTVELWSRAPNAARGGARTADVAFRPIMPDDERLLARAVQRRLGPYAASALSMVPGELSLPDTRDRFAAAGLTRERECSVATRAGECIYAVVEEHATPGLNLTWMLNASWILPIHPELDPDGTALDRVLQEIVDRPAQSMTGECFLNLPEGIDPGRLQAWGFAKEAELYMYVLTRAGVHRFFNYTAARYGELGALATRRERRRAVTRGRDDDG